jgi:TolB-like protein/serine/threonine protein kinase/Flp pilus assembly protein TadD
MNPERWQQLKTIVADALEKDSPVARTALVSERCADDDALLRAAESLLRDAEPILRGKEDALEECAETVTGLLGRDWLSQTGQRIGAYIKATVTTRIKSDPARWQRLKHILADALEHTSAAERTAALKESCADDTTLLREAEKLLAHDTTDFEDLAEFVAKRLTHDERDRIGERIGAYVVVRELGRGGMGAVYLAERADGQFEKRVAIKVLKRGTDTDEVLRRFRIERQILANLEHPNITRLLDAGTTSDGLPYFVMEFIEGTPIARFVQRENLDLPGRIKLFLKVCSAVDFAHRHQIIHRDIKPGNVLVNDEGEPKLLDFGIAKLLSDDSEDGITTVVADRRLTPMYAAPEQSAGQPATVATDVYSLGALLYELLVGKAPHGSSNGRRLEDDVFEHLFGSPLSSEVVADSKTRQKLLGQLDQIIARAMQRDPAQRYRSVAEMSQDLERCLNGAALLSENFSMATSDKESGAGNSRVGASSRRRWYIAAAVVGVMVLAGAALSGGPGVRWLQNQMFGKAPAAATPVTVAETVRSIAVLPFEPLGQGMNDELLGLGMADAIIGRMSNLKQLAVLPTSAVSKYKSPANDPLAAGRALGVDAVLSGTVQRSGDRIRSTVQLVRVASGRTIWSEKFDQTFTDIFGVQDSISDSVAKSLALNLTADEQKQLVKRYTTNAAAYDEYLMGLYLWNTRSRDGLKKAIDHFGRAIEKDPNFALAYSLMADCYYLQLYYGYDSESDHIRNAKAAVERALVLDDSLAEAHLAAALVELYEKGYQHAESDHQAALDSLRRAIALNPNLAIAHLRYANVLAAFGHLDDSVREMRRAQELDPLSRINNAALGISLVFARQYREALDYFYKAAELAPDEASVQNSLAYAYALNGLYQQAIEHYQRAVELDPNERGNVLVSIAYALISAGNKSEADSMMPEILKLAGEGKADPYYVAVLYGARGDKDAAFEWFDKALRRYSETRSNGDDSRMIRYDPMLDPLRSDRRFGALLRQHNLSSLLETPGTATEAVRSIAVLPFEPLGKDMNDEVLGLGMADAIIGRMSNLKQLAVLPTSAVSKYKGPGNDPIAAGRALGVDAILSGTVQRSGDRIRATVQLVRVGSGRTVWSEKFDQTFTDIFGIQDSISDSVAKSLALTLSADEQKQLVKHYTTNAAAYDEYLMGLYFYNTRSRDGFNKAIDHFGRAIEKDPNFALAYALMADCYYLQLYYMYDSRPDRIQNAKAAAERALLLDDAIAEGHVALAMVLFNQRDYQAGMDSLRRALTLNPNLAIEHQRYAWALCSLGHLDDTVREMKRAQELDPLSPTNNTALGMVLAFARQFREALAYCYKAAELDPNSAPIQENLAFAHVLNGEYQQALEHYKKEGELNPESKGDVLAFVVTVFAVAGRNSEAESSMHDLLDLVRAGKVGPYNMTLVYTARGDKERALEWLDKTLQNESDGLHAYDRMIRYDPLLDPLRSDGRFAALLRRHGRGSLLEISGSR